MKQNNLLAKALLFALCCGLLAGTPADAGEGVKSAGDVLVLLLPATAAGLTFGYKDQKGAVQFAEATALTLGTTFLLKYTVREERPNDADHLSFPSGHASVAFSSAEFMRKRYGWEYGVPAYAVASFVAYSRVEARQHYTHDVLAGAVIGIGSSYLFTRPYAGWQLQAQGDSRYYGVRLSRAW